MKKNLLLLSAVLLTLAAIMTGCVTSAVDAPPSDSELALAVITRLENDAVTAKYDFGVTAVDGVVYLRGSAPPSSAIRARAISLALGAEGVVEVVDDLYPPTDGLY